jgi:hypothetical protein
MFHEDVENPTAVFDNCVHHPFAMLCVDLRKHVRHGVEIREHLHAHMHHVVIVSQALLVVVDAFREQGSE